MSVFIRQITFGCAGYDNQNPSHTVVCENRRCRCVMKRFRTFVVSQAHFTSEDT